MGTLRRIGGTWSEYDVPGLVNLLSHEDPKAISEQLGGWWRAETTLTDYRRRLEACRDALAQKWPPEHSEAAAAFVQQVNTTIGELNAAVNAIGRNAGALAQTDNILSLAKHDLDSIHQEWQGYATREQDAEIEGQTLTLGEVKPTGLDPEWREKLNQRARAVMSSVERDLAASADRMVETPSPGNYENVTLWEPSGDGGSGSTASSGQPAAWVPNRSTVRGPAIPALGFVPGVSQATETSGPELAGISLSSPPYSGSSADPAPPGPGSRRATPSGSLGQLGLAPTIVPVLPDTTGVAAIRNPAVSRAYWEPAIPSGRVNPVGGVITSEPREPARTPGIVSRSSQGQQGLPPGGFSGMRGPDRSGRKRGSRAGSGDEAWHVVEGCPAVLQQTAIERPHDPGPGVIGLDR